MTITHPLVSVIVPTRNSAEFLAACLKSIKNQTYPRIELIVVDNYSTDDTKKIARRYADRVLTQGPERSAQANFGVARAKGEFVYKVDSDFVLELKVVAQCVAKARAGYDAVVVHNSPDVSAGWIARVRKFEVDMYKYDLTHSSARFIRKSVYEAIGGFHEEITAGEDYDFQNRLNRAGVKTGFVAAKATHLGEPRQFWPHMMKYFQYGRDFVNYKRNNPAESRQQLALFRGSYRKHWKQWLTHPLRGTAFVGYAACKFSFGSTGYVVGRLRPRHRVAVQAGPTGKTAGRRPEARPLFSLILPLKDDPNPRLWRSLTEQSDQNFELVVIRSGSLPVPRTDFLVRLERSDLGKSAARNRGAELARGRYLIHIDDDMILSPDLIAASRKLVKAGARAATIPEVSTGRGLTATLARLEKEMAQGSSVDSPRLIVADLYRQLGGMDKRLDPIDEGDLKAKLDTAAVPYPAVASTIEIVRPARSLAQLASQLARKYRRGRKQPLFRALHPESDQLKIRTRGGEMWQPKTLWRHPFLLPLLWAGKALDALVFAIGSLWPPPADRAVIANLKNQRIFRREGGSYQHEFYEATRGARYVGQAEKQIVRGYLEDLSRDYPWRILDIGCGGGRWTELMLQTFPKARVVAFDYSAEMLQTVKRTLGKPYRGRLKLKKGDMQQLPFADAGFDLVVCIRAIKYAPNQEKAFREMVRVLRPDGRAIVEVPYRNGIYRLLQRFPVGSIGSYVARIQFVDWHKLQPILNHYRIVQPRICFALPSTLFKKVNLWVVLVVLKMIQTLLPKRLFGRSRFFVIRSAEPTNPNS